LALIVTFSTGCGLCRNEEQNRAKSPDGAAEAVLFQRDCGATTDFSTQISVLPSGSSLGDRSGNVFVAGANNDGAARASWGGPPAAVRWAGPRRLTVTYHPTASLYLEEKSISVPTHWFRSDTITIDFQPDANVGGVR
jgi:hypothetical protein